MDDNEVPRGTQHKLFAAMTVVEKRVWLTAKYEWLLAKREREQQYLDRRARRGTFTPTDEAYQADIPHELDLLRFFEELAETLFEPEPPDSNHG